MTLLAPYRVLDLTDVRGQIAGMTLADLGADVIRTEPKGGSDARRSGPFLASESGDERLAESERSLSFAAYNRNKRSIEIDFETESGRGQFEGLVRSADFLLDSGPPSLLETAGYDVAALRALNPELVHVRTTPFGADGPKADRPAADLTIAALAGPVSLQGTLDRAPVRLSIPQAWRHAGAEAAVAALIGHARMRTTGEGVFVDVSAQSALTWTMLNGSTAFATQGFDFERQGSNLQIGPAEMPTIHPCKDGHVVALALGSLFGKLRPWILEAGIVQSEELDREDWTTYDYRVFRGGDFEIPFAELGVIVDRFLATRTKKELFRPALEELGITIAPVQTLDDLLDFDQLEARDYFVETELPNGQRVRAPGRFARLSATPIDRFDRAPRLGEHTAEILGELEAVSKRRIALRESGAIGAGSERTALPLEGLKVADYSWVGVGPISGKYLADHGANVVRVESSTRADNLRTAGPYKDDEAGWNRSQFFAEFNTSKRSLSLDLKHPGAADVNQRLLGWADVVLESFTPGAVDRIGIGYEAARAINPRIVMVSSCLLGQTGPCAQMAGYGYHAAGLAGFTEITGWPDRAPDGPWNAYTDTVAPRFLTATLLAALDHVRRTGEGQHIDLGQLEAAVHFLAPEILSRQANGTRYSRNGNRSLDAAPQGIYPCRGDDQWCAIAVETDVQWQQLRRALGDPDWAQGPALATADGRLAQHDLLDTRLSEWTRKRGADEAMEALAAAGVPAGRVQQSRDLHLDPQLIHRGFHREFEHGEMGRMPYSGHQFRVSGYDNGPRGPAPLLGGESFEILADELGYTPEEVADMMASGAIS